MCPLGLKAGVRLQRSSICLIDIAESEHKWASLSVCCITSHRSQVESVCINALSFKWPHLTAPMKTITESNVFSFSLFYNLTRPPLPTETKISIHALA